MFGMQKDSNVHEDSVLWQPAVLRSDTIACSSNGATHYLPTDNWSPEPDPFPFARKHRTGKESGSLERCTSTFPSKFKIF